MNFTLLQTKNRIPLLVFLLMILSVIFLVPDKALAGNPGPSFTHISPTEGATLNYSRVTISARVVDPDLISYNSVILMLDGNLTTPIKQYGWLEDYTEDLTTMDIYLPVTLAEGTHTVRLTVADMKGNSSTKEWSFAVSQPPVISQFQPARDSAVDNAKPVISAKITDNTAVDSSSVEMYLNGQKVNAQFNSGTGMVSYTPTDALTNEKWHTVVVKAKDVAGYSAEATWRFFVNSHGEMTFTFNDKTCQQCHQRSSHPMNNCSLCHGDNISYTNPTYPLDDCYKCHYSSKTDPPTYHNNGLPYLVAPLHGYVGTDSCIECHGKTWATGIPSLHDIVETAERHISSSQGCTNCHAGSLTREHAGRFDASGKELNCFTCHINPNPKIKEAIVNKDSSCSACHDNLDSGGGHPMHEAVLDKACQTCHSDSILEEPLFHSSNGCAVCHQSSARPQVKYAIESKNTNCAACHTKGHNLNMVEKSPDDLPKYPGYQWSVPQPTEIWAGEPWLPAEFNTVGSKIIISSRKQDVTASELFSWYEEQMTLQGWQKLNGPTQPSGYMVFSYQKGMRVATLIIYNGEYHGVETPVLGYRVEILYK